MFYFAGDKSWPTDTNHNFNEFDSNTAYHHPNSIYHNHQLAPNANLHMLPSPHHPAALAPQDYYHLYYHPSSTAAGTLRLHCTICLSSRILGYLLHIIIYRVLFLFDYYRLNRNFKIY